MRHPYSISSKIFLLAILMFLGLITCTGCGTGWTDNAKTIRFQIPALLDVEFEYNDDKGTSDPESLTDVFTDDQK